MHLYFAILVWVGVQLGVHTTFLNPIPYLFATLLPDADHKRAPMGRFIPLWIWFKHRGWTHTIWALVTFSTLIGAIFGLKWGLLSAWGYFIHLALDSGTSSGVKWLGRKKHES